MTDVALLDRRLQRWLSDADEHEQAVASVLATSIVATPDSLASAVASALDIPRATGMRAAARLLDRPFIERVADGYRLHEPLADRLRAKLRNEDHHRYVAVANTLVQNEQAELQHLSDEDERWFARGRIAYYLAALDPEQSARSFIEVFAHPPTGDPGPPRSWLAELAVRKEPELAEQARAVAFFVGFQRYKDGRPNAARRAFETVLGGPEMDAYRAIALHLWVTLSPDDADAQQSLRESIRLSEDLGLVENEVMARNTLVYKMVGSAERRRNYKRMRRAASLAETNLRRAEQSGDDYLLTWCLSAEARTRWLVESDIRASGSDVPEEVAETLLKALRRAQRRAQTAGDVESVAECINAAAQIQRDRGNYQAAVRTLEEGLRWARDTEPPVAARRWAQTAGSMGKLVFEPKVRRDLQNLRRQLNLWLRPA